MKSAIINTCDWGSTGRIALGLLKYLNRINPQTLFCYGRGARTNNQELYRFSSPVEVFLHAVYSAITGRMNGASVLSTKRLIRRLRKEGINSVYLLNLHGKYLNERLFFNYLVKDHITVVYIMADESAYLGNCAYRNGCDSYKEGCITCKSLRALPRLLNPRVSSDAFKLKEWAYSNLNITFIAPEYVIKCGLDSPLLKGKDTAVIDEAINVNVNTPKDASRLRVSLGIPDDKIIIGCVAPYGPKHRRKGVEFFIAAANQLETDNRFVFVHVGYLSENKSSLPSNYIPIGFVNDQNLLSEYYSLFDVFVFPSVEDTMPNACLEALSCGTPLICFDISGMPYLGDSSVLTLVAPRDVEQLVSQIKKIEKKTPQMVEVCRNYALSRYDSQHYFMNIEKVMRRMNRSS